MKNKYSHKAQATNVGVVKVKTEGKGLGALKTLMVATLILLQVLLLIYVYVSFAMAFKWYLTASFVASLITCIYVLSSKKNGLSKAVWIIFLLLGFMAALLLLFSITNQKKAVKIEKERMEVTHKGIVPTLQITVAEDIHMVSPQMERHLDFTSVEKILETKNLIVLLLKGNMTITLCKTGFTEGTWENCLTYLKNMIKR